MADIFDETGADDNARIEMDGDHCGGFTSGGPTS